LQGKNGRSGGRGGSAWPLKIWKNVQKKWTSGEGGEAQRGRGNPRKVKKREKKGLPTRKQGSNE